MNIRLLKACKVRMLISHLFAFGFASPVRWIPWANVAMDSRKVADFFSRYGVPIDNEDSGVKSGHQQGTLVAIYSHFGRKPKSRNYYFSPRKDEEIP